MSGGSWDYSFTKINDIAERLKDEKSPLRRALGEHLELISDAMKAIEWNDSDDWGPEEERKAIVAVFEDLAEQKEIEVLLKDGKELISALNKLGVK